MAKTEEQIKNDLQRAEEKEARAKATAERASKRVKKIKEQAKKFTEAKKRELDMEILAEAKKFCLVYLAYRGINGDINDQEGILELLKTMIGKYEHKMAAMAEAKGGAGGTPAER